MCFQSWVAATASSPAQSCPVLPRHAGQFFNLHAAGLEVCRGCLAKGKLSVKGPIWPASLASEYLKHPCQDSGKLHPPPSTGVIWEQSQDHFSKTLGVSQAPVPGFWQTSSPALHWHDMGAEPRSFFQDTSNTGQGARLLICWVAPPNAISRMPRLLRVPMISRSAS